MSRLSRRQHLRKGVQEEHNERLRLGRIAQAKSLIEMMRLAGETDGQPFHDYDGSRPKKFHDIVLKDGTTRFTCYPNADSWHPWGKGNGDSRTVKDDEVAMIRLSARDPWSEV